MSAALAASLLVMVGCHSYIPSDSPAPGSVARVRIPTGSAAEGPNAVAETASLEGVVVSAGDTIVLAMRIRREWGNDGGTLRTDTVRLSRDRLSSIEVKEVATGKSLLLTAAIAGAAMALALTLDVGPGIGLGDPEEEEEEPSVGGAVITLSLASIIAKLFGGG